VTHSQRKIKNVMYLTYLWVKRWDRRAIISKGQKEGPWKGKEFGATKIKKKREETVSTKRRSWAKGLRSGWPGACSRVVCRNPVGEEPKRRQGKAALSKKVKRRKEEAAHWTGGSLTTGQGCSKNKTVHQSDRKNMNFESF